jgi:hypothetical protein
VRDPDGAPIAGAELALYPGERWPLPEPLGSGVSGPDGRFAFPAGPADSASLTITARAEGYQDVTKGMELRPGEEIALELNWSVALSGRVRDARSGAPLAGVELSNDAERTSSDRRGDYRLGGFPSGLRRSLRARLAGYAADAHEVLARGKEARQLDLELTPGTALEVEAVDRETGLPLTGVRVSDAYGPEPWTLTDERGRFTVWIAPEHPLDLDLALDGYFQLAWQWTPGPALAAATPRLPLAREAWIEGRITRRCTGDLLVEAGAKDVELLLPEMGRLRLCLIDADTRRPVQPSARFLVNVLGWKRAEDEGFREEHAEIDLEGCLELELPVGDHSIRLDLAEEGYLPAEWNRLAVTSEPAAAPLVRELVRGLDLGIQFRGEAAGASPLHGHLVFLVERAQLGSIDGPFPSQGPPSNHRINGICMRLDDPRLMHQLLTGKFHETGRALLRGLAPGRYTLECYPDDFAFEPAGIELTAPPAPPRPEKRELEVRWRPR